jgi:DNA polymerase-1
MLGRRRYIPDIHVYNNKIRKGAENQAMNSPIQGTSADIIKISMLRIYNAMNERRFSSKMLLPVHDELVFEVHKAELDEIQALVTNIMSSALKLKVPLLVESSIGNNWSEAH